LGIQRSSGQGDLHDGEMSAAQAMTNEFSPPAFARKGLLGRAAPFLGTMLLALCVYPLPPTGNEPQALGGAAVLSALIVLVAIFAPWSRLPRFAEVVPPLAYFVVIALLRESDGGARSAYAVLAMLPMFWLALYGSRRDLGIAIAAVAAVFLTPPLLVGAPEYPASEWTRAILWICVAPIVGYTVQGLVRELRTRAIASGLQTEQLLASQEEAHQLIVNMAAVTDATREISRTTDAEVARQVICSAACTITGGRFATLMEPDGSGALAMTANHGLQGSPPIRLQLDGEASGATQAFRSARALFVDDARTSTEVSQRLTRATGAVSIHFEPVVRNEEPIGVLVVGWNHVIQGLERQTISAIKMLAAETAMMIERANLLAKLEQNARTDDLTGLLNRRAWEETLPREMARARRAPHPLCVAMLDLDFFKAYNDERGHQAGDRLLKQSTAAWASELRASDVLSRYGGEEFTIALPGCSLGDAKTIVERLRAAMPSGQTVSAGVACWNGRESAEELVGRADAALYEAKRTGRDRLVTAGDAPGDLKSVAL
jgi:diguanylate cyclase (GGDEF)-like protein